MEAFSALANRRVPDLPRGLDGDDFLAAFTACTRRFGKAPLATEELAALPWPVARTVDELARVALLVDRPEMVPAAWASGDLRERVAVLRALPLCAAPERFVPLAVEACRANALPVFEAIAAENPFPARCFAEAAFNQMVLKAIFVGVAVARIVDLGARMNADLQRMAADYASERRAAGRPVPDDVDAILAQRTR